MRSTNHRIISLSEVGEEFNIEYIFGADFEELIIDHVEEDATVMVFDGDTEFTGDIDLCRSQGIAFGEDYDYSSHDIIIVNGNLNARNIKHVAYPWSSGIRQSYLRKNLLRRILPGLCKR